MEENSLYDDSNLQILIEYPDISLVVGWYKSTYILATIINAIKVGKKIISMYNGTDIEQLATDAIEPFKFNDTHFRSREIFQESIMKSYFYFVDISELAKYNNDSTLEDMTTEAKNYLDKAYESLKEYPPSPFLFIDKDW